MSEKSQTYKKVGGEFVRYLFVGGFAFVADFLTLILCREFLFASSAWGVYAAVLLGFAVGHVSNYVLSLLIVFRDPEERKRGWTWKSFWLFTLVGASGAGLTELGMFIGYGALHFNYVLVKIFVAGVVMVWNFVGRKLTVMTKREK